MRLVCFRALTKFQPTKALLEKHIIVRWQSVRVLPPNPAPFQRCSQVRFANYKNLVRTDLDIAEVQSLVKPSEVHCSEPTPLWT